MKTNKQTNRAFVLFFWSKCFKFCVKATWKGDNEPVKVNRLSFKLLKLPSSFSKSSKHVSKNSVIHFKVTKLNLNKMLFKSFFHEIHFLL